MNVRADLDAFSKNSRVHNKRQAALVDKFYDAHNNSAWKLVQLLERAQERMRMVQPERNNDR